MVSKFLQPSVFVRTFQLFWLGCVLKNLSLFVQRFVLCCASLIAAVGPISAEQFSLKCDWIGAYYVSLDTTSHRVVFESIEGER